MKGRNFHCTKIRIPTFGGSAHIFICSNLKKAIREVEEKIGDKILKEGEEDSIMAFTYCCYWGDKYMMFFRHNSSPGIIAHEAKHFVNILFRWNNYNLSTTNDEIECIMLEKIVDKIHRVFYEYKKKKYKKRKRIYN
jgi:poly(A) polymerase Pap1